MRSDYADVVVVMPLLALGAEKMLKLTIGFATLEQDAPWPKRKYTHDEIGHQVKGADQRTDCHSNFAQAPLAVGWMIIRGR